MADYYTLLTNAGIAYETACKANGQPIKLTKMSVGDGNGAVYNPDATATALRREVWRGDINALLQDANNPSWLVAELDIPDDVGGWSVREAGIWTDTGILYAIIKYPESYKPVLATSGAGKEFYIRAIFQTTNASSVTLVIDETVVKATRAWVVDYVAAEIAKLDFKKSVRVVATSPITLSAAQQIDGVAVVAGDRVLVTAQALSKDNGIWVVANNAWQRALDADASAEVTPGLVVVVEEGAQNADSVWQLVTNAPIVLGTTALSFELIAGKTGIGAGTYRSLTIDKYGRVVGGSNPTTIAGYAITDAYTKAQVDAIIAQVSASYEAKLPLRGSQSWTVAGVYQFVVPEGVTKGYVKVIGGGGSGRNSQIFGPGGGGGGVAEGLVDLVPGSTITITVGAGGPGISYSVSGGPGTPGGTSSFGSVMSATGGGGGDSSGGGGKGGVGTGGELNYGLGDGHSGVRNSSTVWGCPGNGGGAGGAGAVVDGSGVGQSPLRPGQAPGAGGGGRMDNGGLSGAGKDGAVSIRY